MLEQQDKQETAYLEWVNADISTSLRRCHALVDKCRILLASNSNEPEAANDEDEAANPDPQESRRSFTA